MDIAVIAFAVAQDLIFDILHILNDRCVLVISLASIRNINIRNIFKFISGLLISRKMPKHLNLFRSYSTTYNVTCMLQSEVLSKVKKVGIYSF